MSATKKARRRPVKGFSLEERAALEPLIVDAAEAAVRQAEAEATYDSIVYPPSATYEERVDAEAKIGAVAEVAQRETCRAGKALGDARAKLRGGK